MEKNIRQKEYLFLRTASGRAPAGMEFVLAFGIHEYSVLPQ